MRRRSPKRFGWVGIVFPLVLVVLFFLIIAEPINKKDGFFSAVLAELAFPFQKGFHYVSSATMDTWKRYIFLIDIVDENENLKKQNALLAQSLLAYQEKEAELYRLQKLLSLKELKQYKHIGARVIAKSISAANRVLVIDQGLTTGIQVGMPVICALGIVGKVVEVSWHTARVLLITDFRSNIDAITQESRASGVLQGVSTNLCRLKYVSLAENVTEGDIVLSSNIDGIYPKGLALGSVKSVEKRRSGFSQDIEVIPAVDFSKLEEVVVLMQESSI